MGRKIISQIRKKAYNVMGRKPWVRPEGDPAAEGAIRDAKSFVKSFSSEIDIPNPDPDCTSNPKIILSFNWHFMKYRPIKSVSLHFKGSSKCDIRWNNPDSKDYFEYLDIEVGRIGALIPTKLADLTQYPGPYQTLDT